MTSNLSLLLDDVEMRLDLSEHPGLGVRYAGQGRSESNRDTSAFN